MPQQSHPESQSICEFTLHDDSHRAKVVLGSTFSMQGPACDIEGIKTLVHHVANIPENWEYADTLMVLDITSQTKGTMRWRIGCEENSEDTNKYRAVATNQASGIDYYLHVHNSFRVEGEPYDLMEYLPDSVFGALLGAATGMTEARKLLLDAAKNQDYSSSESPRSDWRAPRFSFTLQTASGSPFVERWAFAIQESTVRAKRFRVWIEQQRTGREMQLLLRDDGTIEGIHEVETLPAAIHGAALGMLMGINYTLHNVQQAGLDDPNITQKQRAFPDGLSDQEVEALLDHYVAQIRERRNTTSDS